MAAKRGYRSKRKTQTALVRMSEETAGLLRELAGIRKRDLSELIRLYAEAFAAHEKAAVERGEPLPAVPTVAPDPGILSRLELLERMIRAGPRKVGPHKSVVSRKQGRGAG